MDAVQQPPAVRLPPGLHDRDRLRHPGIGVRTGPPEVVQRALASEIERRGIGGDRVLFASDEPWGDFTGEVARMRAAAGDGALAEAMLRGNFAALYDLKQ
jgi:predicted TIM-barrel fold metal-dependent hydrolase